MVRKEIALQGCHRIRDPRIACGIIAPKVLVGINLHPRFRSHGPDARFRLSPEIEEPSVNRIIRPGDKRGFIGAQKQGERSDFLRFAHAADGLRCGQLLKHLLFSAGIVFLQVAVDERSMHAGRRNAVAADLVVQIILGDGIGHGDYRTLAHRIRKAISQGCGARDGSHIQNHTAALRFHVPDSGVRAVVDALHVDAEETVEIGFRRSLDGPDVRDTRVVDENIEASLPRQSVENFFCARLIGNITRVGFRILATGRDFLRRRVGRLFIEIKDAHGRALLSEAPCNGSADPAGGTGDDSHFSVEAESIAMLRGSAQRETPRFHGMKSFCASNSALVRSSPLATCMTRSKMCSPICSMVVSPEMIPPVSMSMMSGMRRAKSEFVDSLMTGAMGLPVGVPRPVVNKTKFAPAPTCAVTHSTSLPGVHCKFKPGCEEYSG